MFDDNDDDQGDNDDHDDDNQDDYDNLNLASGYWASAGWLAMWEMVRPLETSTPR